MTFSKNNKPSSCSLFYIKLIAFLENFMGPLLFFAVRLWIARIFWYSGMSKIQSWWTTEMLFENVYKVPDMSPIFAAYFTVGFELFCPVFLVLGFATRIAALPLLIMSGVIHFTFDASVETTYWVFLLAFLLCYGPGPLSLDYLFWKRYAAKANKIF